MGGHQKIRVETREIEKDSRNQEKTLAQGKVQSLKFTDACTSRNMRQLKHASNWNRPEVCFDWHLLLIALVSNQNNHLYNKVNWEWKKEFTQSI